MVELRAALWRALLVGLLLLLFAAFSFMLFVTGRPLLHSHSGIVTAAFLARRTNAEYVSLEFSTIV